MYKDRGVFMCKLRIRDLREDKDMTQAQIASILGTNQKVYSRYETGINEIPMRHIVKLADYYNVSIDYSMGTTNDKTPSARQAEQKKYSPTVLKAAEEIRENFRKAKGREPTQEDLNQIVSLIDAIVQNLKN